MIETTTISISYKHKLNGKTYTYQGFVVPRCFYRKYIRNSHIYYYLDDDNTIYISKNPKIHFKKKAVNVFSGAIVIYFPSSFRIEKNSKVLWIEKENVVEGKIVNSEKKELGKIILFKECLKC